MIDLWPHWLRPLWLLALPPLGWLLWRLWHRERRSGRWQHLLPAAFQPWLLLNQRARGARLPWIALGLAWLLAVLALIGPSWRQVEQSAGKRADPLVVMLELTPAMLAADAPPSRLEQARRKLLDLLQARRDAQTALVVYAGSAHTLVPLSDDLMTARNLLEALKPSIMPVAGRRADLAVAKALALLDQGAQGQGRLLLITSRLDREERHAIRAALGSRGARLSILGVGTPQGAPVAQENGGFLKDEHGAILLPKLDAKGLKRFAGTLGGRYANARLDDRDLRGLGLLDETLGPREETRTMRLQAWVDQGHWLLLPLLLLAACAGRRGWLFCLPLLLALPQPSQAFELADLWLRPDQQGQRLLQAQRPAEAAQRFENRQWQGLALYQAGDYAGAAERFASEDSAAAHYNRGNALARAGQLEAALDAYESALERQPDLQPAQRNRALVEEMLKERQQRPSSPDAGEPSPSAKPSTGASSPGGGTAQEGQGGQADPNASPSAGSASTSPSPDDGKPDAPPPQASTHQAPPSAGKREETAPRSETASAEPPPPGQPAPGNASAGDGTSPSQAPAAMANAGEGRHEALGEERRQALEQWLRQIPDDPAELLRRKFWYEQQRRQETAR